MAANTSPAGTRGMVTGIADADGFASGCARALRHAGAELAAAARRTRRGALVTIEPAGRPAAFLVGAGAGGPTGSTLFVDAGAQRTW